MRPKLLDLFCGQGGAARGYLDAGFDVTGVDLADHGSRYPGDFIQGDALAFLAQFGSTFDAIHYVPRSIPVQQALLGIDWMTVKGMQESIPPVYAQHVGMQLMTHLVSEVAA